MTRRVEVLSTLGSGVLLGCAFPPLDVKGLAWIGLVPLWGVTQAVASGKRVFSLGAAAGFVYFLITLYPLVSAHSWTGWAAETPTELSSRLTRQWWFLHGIWVLFAAWGALFWGAWALGARRIARSRRWWVAMGAGTALWVLVPEWARVQTTFGFTWALLGHATADWPAVRQGAAVGGVWLLTALVAAVNLCLAESLWRGPGRERRASLGAAVTLLAFSWAAGANALRAASPPADRVKAAVLQRTKPTYRTGDFLPIGLDQGYVPMVRQALEAGARLIALPESIVLGAVTLDASASAVKPPERQIARAAWDAAVRDVLGASGAVVVVGMDTVEHGQDHNTLVAWTREGVAGWYHKRGLVPFSETMPPGWGALAVRGVSQYAPGQGSQLIRTRGLVLGGFICQEVLLPDLVRRSVRDGATVLVTGGNDGVFEHPAVARVHADAAQLRAVETRRAVVRAMKTGISAVIDPWGREQVRSRSAEPAVLVGTVQPRQDRSPYVRFGNWVVGVSALLVAAALARRPSSRRSRA